MGFSRVYVRVVFAVAGASAVATTSPSKRRSHFTVALSVAPVMKLSTVTVALPSSLTIGVTATPSPPR